VNKPLTLLSAAVALSLGLSCATASYAQDQAAPPPPGPGAHDGHHWDPAAMKAHMEARRQAHEQMLHDALGLRGDQEGAWQAFIASMRPPEGEGDRHHMRPDGAAPLTTPERLDKMAQRMSEHQARFQHHADAVKTFYAALDARQQKTFDALMARGGGGRDGHGFGRHGFGGHGPEGQG